MRESLLLLQLVLKNEDAFFFLGFSSILVFHLILGNDFTRQ